MKCKPSSGDFVAVANRFNAQTILLPLFITEQTGHVLAWKHGIAVLTAGEVKVTSNPRIRLMPPQQGIIDTSARASQSNSYNLEIQNVRMTDAGDYACQIGSIVPKEIVHSLEVLGKLFATWCEPCFVAKLMLMSYWM